MLRTAILAAARNRAIQRVVTHAPVSRPAVPPLAVLQELRLDFPDTGAVLQAYLRRTEGDCRDLAHAGSRVRLCKGAYDEPASVAFDKRLDVDRSYVRCVNVLLAGEGYPMFAT